MHLCEIAQQFSKFRALIATKFPTTLHLDEYKFLVSVLYFLELSGEENEFFSSNPTIDKVTFPDSVSDCDKIIGNPLSQREKYFGPIRL